MTLIQPIISHPEKETDTENKHKIPQLRILYVNPGKINSGLDYMIKGPPLALLSIAAMVPEHKATLYDFKVESYKEKKFKALIQEHDVVAITSMTPQIEHAYEVATMAKEAGKITIIGGYHPTLVPDEVILHPSIDYLVRSEGEHTFKEITTYLAMILHNKTPPMKIESILGISYKITKENEIKPIHNDSRPLEPNLDVFPIPRRDLLNVKKYSYMGAKVMLMETSRGCPHSCDFCCISKMWGDTTNIRKYRTKSVKRVMQEIYSIDHSSWDFIFFNDDNFTINIKRTKKILEMIKKSKIHHHIKFTCQTRVDTLSNNPWIVDLMDEANMKMVFLGIESAHQQSLDKMNKNTTVEMIEHAVKLCHDRGIIIFGGIIIGYMGETVEMVRETIDFARSLELEFVQFTPITAFPGTPFFDEMKEKGRIATYNYKYYNLFSPMMRTEEISFVELYNLVGEAYVKYYNNGTYFKQMITKMFTSVKWFIPIANKWLKQFAQGGLKMLHENGFSTDMLKPIDQEQINKPHHYSKWELRILGKKQRYIQFKDKLNVLLLILKEHNKGIIQIKSPILKKYLLNKGIIVQ